MEKYFFEINFVDNPAPPHHFSVTVPRLVKVT